MTEANPKLDIWNALSKTAPQHTKAFTRGGGFRGTAIKPIYTTQKMTEQFGPAGYGWGMGEPQFQMVSSPDGEVLVYCTVSVWYAAKPDDGERVINTVWGVGGDKAIAKQRDGLRGDDEAFKKAFTDAVGNAMKHLGMSADVHMGLFDDSKYVSERRAEEAEERKSPAGQQLAQIPPGEDDPEMSNTAAKVHWKAISDEMFKCTTLRQLQGVWERHSRVIAQLPEGLLAELREWKDQLKDKLMAQAEVGTKAATPPNFDREEA